MSVDSNPVFILAVIRLIIVFILLYEAYKSKSWGWASSAFFS